MMISARQATTLWMEAGALSGPPEHRHQIELPNELAEFFEVDGKQRHMLKMRVFGKSVFPRPLTFRGQSYGQYTEIWRLQLPTVNMGGPEYSNKIIRIAKIQLAGETVYEVTAVEPDTPDSRHWRRQSEAHGRVGKTGGASGRNYGYW